MDPMISESLERIISELTLCFPPDHAQGDSGSRNPGSTVAGKKNEGPPSLPPLPFNTDGTFSVLHLPFTSHSPPTPHGKWSAKINNQASIDAAVMVAHYLEDKNGCETRQPPSIPIQSLLNSPSGPTTAELKQEPGPTPRFFTAGPNANLRQRATPHPFVISTRRQADNRRVRFQSALPSQGTKGTETYRSTRSGMNDPFFTRNIDHSPIALDRALRNLVCNTNSLTFAICSLDMPTFRNLKSAIDKMNDKMNVHGKWDTSSPPLFPVIVSIIQHRVNAHGIDYLCKIEEGRNTWVRDTDIWSHQGGAVQARRFWAASEPKKLLRGPLKLAVLTKLTRLPQYRGVDGDFFRELKADAERGSSRMNRRA
jgi:hypothetical protein